MSMEPAKPLATTDSFTIAMSNKVEHIKPYTPHGSKREQVEQMFDSIAPAYDFMNRAMTMGIDRMWRRVAVNKVKRHLGSGAHQAHLLDVATGTGDFAIGLKRHIEPERVVGIDLSRGMLDVARKKVAEKGVTGVTFSRTDCLNMDFARDTFHAVTVAFGVRNFEDLLQGYKQMYRVIKPGGMLCVLELSTPRNAIVRWFYDIYTLHIIPAIGALKSGDRNAYRYLPLSIAAVPQGDDMLALMHSAGFDRCEVTRLTLGTCSIYTAVK